MKESNGSAVGTRPSARKTATFEQKQNVYINQEPVIIQQQCQSSHPYPEVPQLPLSGILQRSRPLQGESPPHQNDNNNGKGKSVSFKMEDVVDITVVHAPARLTHLSLQQLFLLNTVVCGLEFCASAAFTYIPPMLLKAGIEEEHMSLILGIGPLLGFFFVPIIGASSDTCRSRYGRRRPFIFGLGCLLIFSLMIIPYGELMASYFFGQSAATKTLGIGFLIVGSVLLDFTSQAGLTPCEALLSDASRNTNQQERAFTVYSFMVSLGGCIGYFLTALDWSSYTVGLYFGGQEQSAFSVLIVLFTLALFTTLIVAEEKPVIVARQPSIEYMSSDKGSSENVKKINQTLDQIHQAIVRDKDRFGLGPTDPGYETSSNQSINDEYQSARLSNLKEELELANNGSSDEACSIFARKQWHIPFTRWTFTTCEGLSHIICMRIMKLMPRSIKTLYNVPAVLKRLALANYCSWTAVMGFNLFYTDYVGQAVYGGNPNAPEDSHERVLYDEGVRMASWGLLFHCITSAIYATIIDRLVTRYSMRTLYCGGMFSFAIAMTVMVFVHNIYVVNLMAACTGFAYATVTTVPFMLVQNYHTNKEVNTHVVR